MKRFLLTLSVLAIAATTFAQRPNYQPVPFDLDNSVWYEYYVDMEAYENKSAKGNYYHFVQYTLDSIKPILLENNTGE